MRVLSSWPRPMIYDDRKEPVPSCRPPRVSVLPTWSTLHAHVKTQTCLSGKQLQYPPRLRRKTTKYWFWEHIHSCAIHHSAATMPHSKLHRGLAQGWYWAGLEKLFFENEYMHLFWSHFKIIFFPLNVGPKGYKRCVWNKKRLFLMMTFGISFSGVLNKYYVQT